MICISFTNFLIACFARIYDSDNKIEVHKFDSSDITYQNLSDKFIMVNATYRCNPQTENMSINN